MMTNETSKCRTELDEWKALQEHAQELNDIKIKQHFERDPKRFEKFHLKTGSLLLDYSKQNITLETIDKLVELAEACDLSGWRQKLFDGEPINDTEKRAVLHTTLRDQERRVVEIDEMNVQTFVTATKDKMRQFSNKVRTEGKIKHIVNIGIGGSDLPIRMAYQALRDGSGPQVHFVSNMDHDDLKKTLDIVDPRRTLFIVTSKTFATLETIINAETAKNWITKVIGPGGVVNQFIAVTQNINAAKHFGILEENIFPMWDWVGGRFSLWSGVGLALCLGVGFDKFQEMHEGAFEMDKHFVQASFEENMPVILALIGIWKRNFLGYDSLSIAPYSERLSLFPDYLQQLDMESNGKSVTKDGKAVAYDTGQIIFGSKGTNAQHAYFQLFHQGTTPVPCDFILVKSDPSSPENHHIHLLSNAIAQSKAFMEGKESKDVVHHFEGNRPSNTLVLTDLSAFSLGMLIALYEHKVFVQGVLWNINSFDQFGVELGKTLSKDIVGKIRKNDFSGLDSSSAGLLKFLFDA
ncbi:MAG: glucose-6-phosphate isomerase [Alphaproteobacteria bacterium]|nr:glucose-6-phosphate isomerase [Alphaproteobacteria bacterium]